MKVEAKLKRTISKKIADQQSRTNSHFPSVWNLQCFAYSTLKWHIREYETRKAQQGQESSSNDTHSDPDLEFSMSTMLEAEITKISCFYEERHQECVEGLKGISSEIPAVCTIRSAGATQVWHDFIIQYCNKAKAIEMQEETPAHFLTSLEGYLLSLVEKQIDHSLLSIFKKLVYIHKLSLHLKSFTQYNVTAIKKLLRRHDEKFSVSISTEWTERIRRESFSTCDSFEKIVVLTKDMCHSLTPSLDDFACPICLGLLCEPVAVQCGHRFCEYCLIVASTSYTFCPMCRMDQQLHPSNHVPDKQLKLYLKQFFPVEYKASMREHRNAKRKAMNCTIS